MSEDLKLQAKLLASGEALKLQADLLAKVPLAAKDLQRVIRMWYPIDGQSWQYGRSRTNLSAQAICDVYNAHLRLFKLLDHDRKPRLADPLECPLRFVWWPADRISPRNLGNALYALADDVHSIALHYGWADALCKDGPLAYSWTWPDVPKIPPELLQSLLDHAQRIEDLTLPWVDNIRKATQSAGQVTRDDSGAGSVSTVQAILTFSAGEFVYRAHTEQLTGIPLQILKALWEAKDKTLTRDVLRDKIWKDDTYVENNTISSHVSAARDALRKAIMATEGSCAIDPIEKRDRGDNLAWRIRLP